MYRFDCLYCIGLIITIIECIIICQINAENRYQLFHKYVDQEGTNTNEIKVFNVTIELVEFPNNNNVEDVIIEILKDENNTTNKNSHNNPNRHNPNTPNSLDVNTLLNREIPLTQFNLNKCCYRPLPQKCTGTIIYPYKRCYPQTQCHYPYHCQTNYPIYYPSYSYYYPYKYHFTYPNYNYYNTYYNYWNSNYWTNMCKLYYTYQDYYHYYYNLLCCQKCATRPATQSPIFPHPTAFIPTETPISSTTPYPTYPTNTIVTETIIQKSTTNLPSETVTIFDSTTMQNDEKIANSTEITERSTEPLITDNTTSSTIEYSSGTGSTSSATVETTETSSTAMETTTDSINIDVPIERK